MFDILYIFLDIMPVHTDFLINTIYYLFTVSKKKCIFRRVDIDTITINKQIYRLDKLYIKLLQKNANEHFYII